MDDGGLRGTRALTTAADFCFEGTFASSGGPLPVSTRRGTSIGIVAGSLDLACPPCLCTRHNCHSLLGYLPPNTPDSRGDKCLPVHRGNDLGHMALRSFL